MDELVAQITAKTGVDPETANRAVAIILKFLLEEGPRAKVESLIEQVSGASDAVASAPEISGGVMGAFNALTAAGLSMGEVQNVTQEFLAYAKSKVGEDDVKDIIGSIPGLSQFV